MKDLSAAMSGKSFSRPACGPRLTTPAMRQNRTRLRIGIYEPSRGSSGPSRYVESILKGIDPREFEVVLFGEAGGPYSRFDGVELETRDSKSRRRQECLPHRLWTGAPKFLKLWSGFGRESVRLASWFRARQIDLLHTNNAGCEESAVAGRLAGVPRIVGTFHVDSSYDLSGSRSGFAHRALECVSNHCLDAAIAVSEATGRNWMRRTRLPPARIVRIYNGIDASKFERSCDRGEARRRLGLPDDGTVIGGVGRLDEAKGFRFLLDAVAMLPRTQPPITLALAGDGPLRQSLQTRASELGIADRVHFLGFRGDVRAVYEALELFVLPSLCEALPYALLEAMAARLPAIGARVGGVSEIIVDGETGLIVPPHDAKSLTAALRRLIDSPELRQRMGEASRDRVVGHFDEKEMVRQTIQLYRELLRRPGRIAA
jgi:glycosyltransferase involved in cell wall biosynthesis